MEQMLHNTTPTNNTLWKPAALTQRHTLHWMNDTPHPFEHMNGTSSLLVTMPHSANNSPAASYDICNCISAFATQFPWQAPILQHHQHPH